MELTIKIEDEKLYDSFVQFFSSLGIKIVTHRTSKEKVGVSKIIKSPRFGSSKDKYTMSSDFDEPLDDFKEYIS